MATQTVEQIQRLAPYLEGLEKRVLGTAFGEFDGTEQTSKGLLDVPMALPEVQVAGLDPLQQRAAQLGSSLVGGYQPALDQSQQSMMAGIGALGAGLGMLDPSQGIQAFMDPYQGAVIDEINRQALMQQNQLGAQAVKAGAFGGSRQAVAAGETERARQSNIGKFLSQGFQQAVDASQKAGQVLGGLGGVFGQLGAQTADVGRLGAELGRADVGSLAQLGRTGQMQSQAELDAERQNLRQQIMEPFTRLELGSSLLKGTPSGSLASVFKSATEPSPNPFLQGVGAYTALAGAGMAPKAS